MDNVRAAQVSSGKLGKILGGCAALVVLLGFLTAASVVVAAFAMPRRYFSKVTMEPPPETGRSASPFDPGNDHWTYNPQYIRTQLANLQKTEILYPVIQRLDLTKEYAPPGTTISQAEAYRHLRASMKLQEVRNTGLVEVGISDTDPQRAANIANAIAVTYEEQLIEAANKRAEELLGPAKTKREAQHKRYAEALRLATEIRKRDGITDPDPKDESSVPTLTANATTPNVTPQASATDNSAAKAKMIEYLDAKRQALQERKNLEQAEVSYVVAKMTATQLPRVKIWEKAEKADQPQNRIASFFESILHRSGRER